MASRSDLAATATWGLEESSTSDELFAGAKGSLEVDDHAHASGHASRGPPQLGRPRTPEASRSRGERANEPANTELERAMPAFATGDTNDCC
jgi:hypothetical protein